MKVFRFFTSVLESRYFIAWITVIGLLIRLALLYYTSAHHNPAFADEDDYQGIGASLSHGGPYSIDGIHLTAFRAPGEAWLIAIIFRVFGPHVVYVKLAEVLLLSIVPFAASVMGRSLGLSLAAANFGAALAGLHPGIAYASTTLYPTALTAFALTLGLFLSVFVFNGKSKGPTEKGAAVGAGLALGLAASSTTAFAPLGILAAIVMAVKRRFSAALIVAVLGTLPVLVWMARNKVSMGEFTVSTNGAINLFLGANDFATPMSGNNLPARILAPYPSYLEVDSENWYRAEAPKWIKAHPLRWGELVILRGILVLDSVGNPATQGLHSGLAAHLIGWMLLPVILLSVVGLFFTYRFPLAWLTMVALSLIILSSALTLTKPRFRFPCDPVLCVFSVVGFTALSRKSRGQADSTETGTRLSSQTTYR